MDKLQTSFDAMLRTTPTSFHRYMFDRINWNNRLLGLVGPRGVGKTTLMLQYAKEKLNRNTTLFVNADDLYFSSHHLVDLADDFVKRGGRELSLHLLHHTSLSLLCLRQKQNQQGRFHLPDSRFLPADFPQILLCRYP